MRAWIVSVLMLLVAAGMALGEPTGAVRVGAAASLREVMGELVAAYREAGGGDVSVTAGGSGQLAAQVRAGAEIDVVVFASRREMATLVGDGLVVADGVREVAGNRLVLVVPAGAGAPQVTSFADLARVPGRVATGEPRSVPAGEYARQVFEQLGLSLGDRLVYATNVRQVLDLVGRSEVAAGVVYATDAATSMNVRVVTDAPAGSHEAVVYPAAVVSTSRRGAGARAFLAFMESDRGRELFARRGFTPAAPPATRPATMPRTTSEGVP